MHERKLNVVAYSSGSGECLWKPSPHFAYAEAISRVCKVLCMGCIATSHRMRDLHSKFNVISPDDDDDDAGVPCGAFVARSLSVLSGRLFDDITESDGMG